MAKLLLPKKPKANLSPAPPGMRAITEDEANYYCKEFIPDIAGTYSGLCIIVGGGKTMWEDLKEFQDIAKGYSFNIMAINISGLMLPHIDHYFSLHHKHIGYLSQFRKLEYPDNKDYLTHSTREWQGVDYVWYPSMQASTSGLIGITMAKLLGYNKFVLVGVPMDGSGYFYKPMINEVFSDIHRLNEIHSAKDKFGDTVKSMSGRTAEIFGKPDENWIRS